MARLTKEEWEKLDELLAKTLNFIMTLRGFTKVQTKTLKR